MNTINDKQPVKIEISVVAPTVQKSSFYTPCFISENDEVVSEVEVFSLSDVLENGYTEDSDAYEYCNLAFLQSPRVDSVVLVAKRSNQTYFEALSLSNHVKYYYVTIDSKDTQEVFNLSTSLMTLNYTKLVFYSSSDLDFSILNGLSNVVVLYQGVRWLWDTGLNIEWDTDELVANDLYIFPEAAWISRCGCIFPSLIQWLTKELVGIESEDITGIEDYNYSTNIEDYNVTWGNGTTCDGEWIDNRVFDDWLKVSMQRNIWNLFKVSPKLSSSNGGVDNVSLKMKEVLEFGVKQQGIISYKIKTPIVNRMTRVMSIDFEYERQHAIIGVRTIRGTLNA